jgi:hypothetical protein
MRAWLAIAGILLASPAWAGPLRIVPHDPLLPHWDVARYTPPAEDLPDYARLYKDSDNAAPAGGLSIGPVHAESETINGHSRVHYRVDGLTMLGGDVGASVGHGGAMLTLHWASSGN